jgi:hypothetical protein
MEGFMTFPGQCHDLVADVLRLLPAVELSDVTPELGVKVIFELLKRLGETSCHDLAMPRRIAYRRRRAPSFWISTRIVLLVCLL